MLSSNNIQGMLNAPTAPDDKNVSQYATKAPPWVISAIYLDLFKDISTIVCNNDMENSLLQIQARAVMNFKFDEPIVIFTATYFRRTPTDYAMCITFNKGLSSSIIELNQNPLYLYQELQVVLYPFDPSMTKVSLSNLMISSDATMIQVDVPSTIVVDSLAQYLLCIVRAHKYLVGVPAKLEFAKHHFYETTQATQVESVHVTEQLLNVLGLQKLSAASSMIVTAPSTGYVSLQQLFSVVNMLNMTALHVAAMLNCNELCLFMVRNGFDPRKKDFLQRNAGSIAKLTGHDRLGKFLQAVADQLDGILRPTYESYLWGLNDKQCKYWFDELAELSTREDAAKKRVAYVIDAYAKRKDDTVRQKLRDIYANYANKTATNPTWFRITVVGGKFSKEWEELVFGPSHKEWMQLNVSVQHYTWDVKKSVPLPACDLIVYVVDRSDQFYHITESSTQTFCIISAHHDPQIFTQAKNILPKSVTKYDVNDTNVFGAIINLLQHKFLFIKQQKSDAMLRNLLGESISCLFFDSFMPISINEAELSIGQASEEAKENFKYYLTNDKTASSIEALRQLVIDWLGKEQNQKKWTELIPASYKDVLPRDGSCFDVVFQYAVENNIDIQKLKQALCTEFDKIVTANVDSLLNNLKLKDEQAEKRNSEQEQFDKLNRFNLIQFFAQVATIHHDDKSLYEIHFNPSDYGTLLRIAKYKPPFEPEIEVSVRQFEETEQSFYDIFSSHWFDHPNIARVIACLYNPLDKKYSLVYEKFKSDVATVTKDVLEPKEKLKLITGLLDALAYIHRKHYMYRTLQPSRIWIDNDFNPKLVGFETAKPKTVSANTLFFSAYSSPEAAKGLATQKSDVYSACAIIYLIWFGEDYKKSKTAVTKALGETSDAKLDAALASIRDNIKPGLEDSPDARPYTDLLRDSWVSMQNTLVDIMQF